MAFIKQNSLSSSLSKERTSTDPASPRDSDQDIQLKTEWKRKGDRVNFFTKEAANADFFDLVGCLSVCIRLFIVVIIVKSFCSFFEG